VACAQVAKIESEGELDATPLRVKQSKRNSDSAWKPLTRPPTPEKWILLEVMRDVWSFRDSTGGLYRCEINPDGNERWTFNASDSQSEYISQSDAARFLGVSRQAIGRAIQDNRLAIVNCNGQPKVCRADVLELKIQRHGLPRSSSKADGLKRAAKASN
jgi:hypothetical protein